jgi:RNA polymerase sigma factor (sigma-70 family)
MSVNNEMFVERIQQIDGKLRSYSRYFAFLAGFLEADDLYQEALLKLYERYVSEPDFLSNNNSYLWCFGVWMMKNAVNHERYVWVNKISEIEGEDGERPRLTNHFPRPENVAIRDEVRAIASEMPEHYQSLYRAIAEGYQMQEIAPMFGVSKWTLTQRKRTMVDRLGKAWRVPPNEREQFIRDM